MSTNKDLFKEWEARLSAEGLGLIEQGNSISPQIFNVFTRRTIKEVSVTSDMSDRNKFIIELYNTGKSLRYIEAELKRSYSNPVSYKQCERIIKKYLKLQNEIK